MAEIISNELHKPIIHKFPRRKVIVNYMDETWACDLMDFSKDPSIHNRNKYNYILVVIDCFSKYCWCYVQKTKSLEELIGFYTHLFKQRKPTYLWWDMEKSIDSKKFKEFLDNQGVKLYHTY